MLGLEIAKKYLTIEDITDNIFVSNEEIKNQSIENRCLARIWDKGEYGKTQCSNDKITSCLCSKHYKYSLRMNGTWWLGLITNERPERPVHPISGEHQWKKDIYGNDYIIEDKIEEIVMEIKDTNLVKRPRGRPKGSKNKNKS